MITLRHLRFLVAVADELSFSRAARRCHVTQPTLSAGLRELEDRLGVRLVERDRRSVVMTALGTEIATRGRKLLTDAQEIEDLATAHLKPEEGDLRLGTIPTVGPFLLPRALTLLRARFPALRLFLREEMTDSLIDGVASGRLDLALIALPYDTGGLAVHPLFEDGYHLATPPGASADDTLEAGRLLLLERGHCLQEHALASMPKRRLQRDESFEATSLPTLTAMVAEGLGATLLPDLAVRAGVAAGQPVQLTPLPEARPRKVALVWRRTSPREAAFTRLGEVLRAAHGELR
ncbi:hydrogen peroxide-inducible genes activator [Rhodosalinus sp.]|uniref:hydrogen peroxide-inducible genes activator n=1 Tax=Rhodosalinus sp. TaxID=2047741 RepID=UPI0035612C6E